MSLSRDQFWHLIDICADIDVEKQFVALTKRLDELSEDEVAYFAAYFWSEYVRLDHWDVWSVAYTVNGGCSDDGFMDFRGWMILKGKQPCEKVLGDPESLVQLFESLDESTMEPSLNFLDNYQDTRFGGPLEIPDLGEERNSRSPTLGSKFAVDDLPQKWPKLWKAFN